MNKLKTIIAVFILVAASGLLPSCSLAEKDGAGAAAAVAEKQIKDFRDAYEYDRNLPLNAEVSVIREDVRHSIYSVHFDSVNGERIPARLHIPSGKEAPYPAIVVQHGYGGDKEFGGLFAGILIPKGYAVIAIDAEYHGERKEAGRDMFSTDADSDERALLQTVIDLRRAIDYLGSRGDMDMERIGYTGASMGGMLGGLLFGVDERVKTAVLIVGGGGWEELVSRSEVDAFQVIRSHVKENGSTVADFVAGWDEVDPVNLIGNSAPRPLLMINCSNDKYVPKETGEAMFAAAGEPKDIRWFECAGPISHFPPTDKAMQLLGKWFKNFL